MSGARNLEAAQLCLDVGNLTIFYQHRSSMNRAVDDVSFQIGKRERVALLGESGSGKSTIARSLIGLLPASATRGSCTIALDGLELTGLSDRRMNQIRGRQIGYVPQDPSNALNPIRTVGDQISEMFHLHSGIERNEVKERVLSLLSRVGLTNPKLRFSQYPHELSGGMRQRILIAQAVALNPGLIIADEPTSALDVTVQGHILDLLDGIREEYGTALLIVTHDLAIAQARTDRIIILRNGRIQEQGPTDAVFSAPANVYTKTLLESRPRPDSPIRAVPVEDRPIAITVADLSHEYATSAGAAHRALDHVSFSVAAGTTHAIVGESGSGKTTILRTLMGLLTPTSGAIRVADVDVVALRARKDRSEIRKFQKRVQLVYQNPYGSLDPRHTVSQILDEPLRNFNLAGEREKVKDLALTRVGLPATILNRLPSQMSGGQCQRVALARALIVEPEILVLDEVVSALDVSVQDHILKLLVSLQDELGLTYVFVSHDLNVVRQISHTVSVVYRGTQVEQGSTEEIFKRPRDPYTQLLLAAVPGHHPAAAPSIIH